MSATHTHTLQFYAACTCTPRGGFIRFSKSRHISSASGYAVHPTIHLPAPRRPLQQPPAGGETGRRQETPSPSPLQPLTPYPQPILSFQDKFMCCVCLISPFQITEIAAAHTICLSVMHLSHSLVPGPPATCSCMLWGCCTCGTVRSKEAWSETSRGVDVHHS